MRIRRSKDDQFLANGSLRTLLYIVNLKFPYESFDEWRSHVERAPWMPASGEIDPKFYRRVRLRTQKDWPELWTNERDRPPALMTLHKMRAYLRRFWLAEHDERARDWHIHRAREFYQQHRIQYATRNLSERISNAQNVSELTSAFLDWNAKREEMLDETPPTNKLENALFQLQERARFPSKRPLECKECIQKPGSGPFFLSDRKSTLYCSIECSQAATRAIKRESYRENKGNWPSTARRRKHGKEA